MATWLLDTNVLLSLLWPPHDFHSRAVRWFLSHRQGGWATCPITELGFLRIVTNPTFTPHPPNVGNAIKLIEAAKQASDTYEFFRDEIPGESALAPFVGRISGHKQLTDAYLFSLALQHKARFATFDRRAAELTKPGSVERAAIEVLY